MRRYKMTLISFVLTVALIFCCCACTAKKNAEGETTKEPSQTTASDNKEEETVPVDAGSTTAAPQTAQETTQETTAPPATTDAPPPVQKPPVSSTLAQAPDAGQAYQDKIIFVGDSTTHHLKNREVLTGGKNTKQVWTPTSGTLTLAYVMTAKILYPDTGTEMTIIDAAGLKKPEIMVITLGMNGISFMDENSFKSVYTDLVLGILEKSPNTKIILQSIFPRERNVNESYASITQDMINQGNIWVKDVAQACGVYYLDTEEVLKDDSGYLRTDYGAGDGIHISRDGYLAILQYIRTHPIPGLV